MAIAYSGLFLTEDANCPAPSGSVATSPLEITCPLVVLLSNDVIDEAFVVVFCAYAFNSSYKPARGTNMELAIHSQHEIYRK